MSFLKKLFSSKPDNKQKVKQSTKKKLSSCPYCYIELEKKPSRKKKCPNCGNYIYVRKGKLHTKEEVETLDWLIRLEHFGITQKQFQQHNQALSKQFGTHASVNDTVWRILHSLITKKTDHEDLKQIYLEMAHIARIEGKKAKPYLSEAAKQELLSFKKMGVRKVKVHNVNDSLVCKKCRALEGKTFTLNKAISKMPVPNLCLNDDGCRCWYVPIV